MKKGLLLVCFCVLCLSGGNVSAEEELIQVTRLNLKSGKKVELTDLKEVARVMVKSGYEIQSLGHNHFRAINNEKPVTCDIRKLSDFLHYGVEWDESTYWFRSLNKVLYFMKYPQEGKENYASDFSFLSVDPANMVILFSLELCPSDLETFEKGFQQLRQEYDLEEVMIAPDMVFDVSVGEEGYTMRLYNDQEGISVKEERSRITSEDMLGAIRSLLD